MMPIALTNDSKLNLIVNVTNIKEKMSLKCEDINSSCSDIVI